MKNTGSLNHKQYVSEEEEMAFGEKKKDPRKQHALDVPPRHCDFDLYSNECEEWKEKYLLLYNEAPRKGSLFCLLGPRGTGKTQMACCVADEVFRKQSWREGPRAKYCKTMEIFLDIRETFDSKKSEKAVFDSYLNVYFLVIDEIQVRAATDWENNVLTYLIDKRYDLMRPTVLIGNLKPEVLSKSLGDSIYSRLIETGGIIECKWASFRKPKITPSSS